MGRNIFILFIKYFSRRAEASQTIIEDTESEDEDDVDHKNVSSNRDDNENKSTNRGWMKPVDKNRRTNQNQNHGIRTVFL